MPKRSDNPTNSQRKARGGVSRFGYYDGEVLSTAEAADLLGRQSSQIGSRFDDEEASSFDLPAGKPITAIFK